jgi:membrane protein YdbS with pleckstrin-like domain
MQLEFNKKIQELIIKDEVPMHSWLIISLMLINGINMGVQLYLMSYQNNETLFIFMLLLAVVSVIVIFYYVVKRSWKSKYLLDEIEGIETRKVYGKERVFLKLRNGKRRSFPVLKNEKELNDFKKTLISMGIKPV